MTSQGRGDVTSPQARDIHADALADDPEHHDIVSCWCCCLDCDFDAMAVWRNDKAAGIENVM